MNLIPTLIDGATVIVFGLEDRVTEYNNEVHEKLIIQFYNWIRETDIEYLVFDFEEEKLVPNQFIIELMKLRKRFKGPFLFSGVSGQGKNIIGSYGYNTEYPFFLTPEDAIRALRIQCPGITEMIINSDINYNIGILKNVDDVGSLNNKKL